MSASVSGGEGTRRRGTVLAVAGLMLALFLVALDQTVVGTALPKIIADLDGVRESLGDDPVWRNAAVVRHRQARRHLRKEVVHHSWGGALPRGERALRGRLGDDGADPLPGFAGARSGHDLLQHIHQRR